MTGRKHDERHERLQGVRPGPGPELARELQTDDELNRSAARRYETPRRYEDGGDDLVMPDNESSLNTKI